VFPCDITDIGYKILVFPFDITDIAYKILVFPCDFTDIAYKILVFPYMFVGEKIRSFPHSLHITRLVIRVTRWMALVEQKQFTFLGNLSYPPCALVGDVLLNL
jgi:hypothetical protein